MITVVTHVARCCRCYVALRCYVCVSAFTFCGFGYVDVVTLHVYVYVTFPFVVVVFLRYPVFALLLVTLDYPVLRYPRCYARWFTLLIALHVYAFAFTFVRCTRLLHVTVCYGYVYVTLRYVALLIVDFVVTLVLRVDSPIYRYDLDSPLYTALDCLHVC